MVGNLRIYFRDNNADDTCWKEISIQELNQYEKECDSIEDLLSLCLDCVLRVKDYDFVALEIAE